MESIACSYPLFSSSCIFCLIHVPTFSRYELYQLEFETSNSMLICSFTFDGTAESTIHNVDLPD